MKKMSVKKLVSYSMFALGAARLAFSLAQHLAGHEVTLIEVFEVLLFLSAGVVLYATDVHKIFVSVCASARKRVEVGVFDMFNYLAAECIEKFYQAFRKMQTGVLSWNMILVVLGATLLLIFMLLSEGYTP